MALDVGAQQDDAAFTDVAYDIDEPAASSDEEDLYAGLDCGGRPEDAEQGSIVQRQQQLQITELRDDVKKKAAEIAALQQQLENKDTQVQKLASEGLTLRINISSLFKTAQVEIKRLQSQLQASRLETVSLQTQLRKQQQAGSQQKAKQQQQHGKQQHAKQQGKPQQQQQQQQQGTQQQNTQQSKQQQQPSRSQQQSQRQQPLGLPGQQLQQRSGHPVQAGEPSAVHQSSSGPLQQPRPHGRVQPSAQHIQQQRDSTSQPLRDRSNSDDRSNPQQLEQRVGSHHAHSSNGCINRKRSRSRSPIRPSGYNRASLQDSTRCRDDHGRDAGSERHKQPRFDERAAIARNKYVGVDCKPSVERQWEQHNRGPGSR